MHKVTWSHEDGSVSYDEVEDAPEVGDVENYERVTPTFKQVVRVEELEDEPEPELEEEPQPVDETGAPILPPSEHAGIPVFPPAV